VGEMKMELIKDKREMLLEWITKIEKDGIPTKKVFDMMWTDVIKVIRGKKSWEEIENYVKNGVDKFSGHHTMQGPDAAKKIFGQISAKIWSINKK